MSIGIGGGCRKISEDSACVVYEYMAYNFHEPNFRDRQWIFDGVILIAKSCLTEPEIPEYRRISRKERCRLNSA